MRALGVPEKILRLMATLDRGAEAKVMTGGAVGQTRWIPLERGAPQGEVMSPLRFIAWVNILLEVLAMNKEWGYTYSSGEKYSGQAFCDDGLFMADSNANLQKISEVVSAFCEFYKVKINAEKSYYMISRG